MALQKYRADTSRPQPDGATVWYARWMGGDDLAVIENCRLDNFIGDMRATVYITGPADTYFSTPAVMSWRGCRVKGYVTTDDDGYMVFRQTYY